MNKNMYSSFFITMNFQIWVYKEMKIHFLLETLGLTQMIPFHTTPKRKKIGKFNKFVCTIQDKENYVVHIRTLKQALNHGLILKKSAQCNSI